MTKIIKLDGENVVLGNDDGTIRNVRIYDVHFAPAVGDEVEVYEDNGSIFVTKKEIPNANNYANQANNYVYYNQKADTVRIFLFVTMIVSILACFLPILSVSVFGVSLSVNYVYNSGNVADGIFVVGLQIIAIILLSLKKRKAVCVFEIISAIVFGITAYNLFDRTSKVSSGSIFDFLGIGFYLLLISLIVSIVLSFINASKE